MYKADELRLPRESLNVLTCTFTFSDITLHYQLPLLSFLLFKKINGELTEHTFK